MKFIATCAGGLETLVADEIRKLGGNVTTVSNGAVAWSGALDSGYRTCLWSRCASRVILVLEQFTVGSADDLYEQSGSFTWEEHIPQQGCFAINCTIGSSALSTLKHSKYLALKVKDAVVDRFRSRYGTRPDIRVRRPDVQLHIHVEEDRVILAVDLSGESLHRRGYRVGGGEAPMKESLAAAIILFSGWQGEGAIIDPCCGSGTILLEAALIFSDSAPGLGRSYFGMTNWLGHDKALWDGLVGEALEREAVGQLKKWPPLLGFDADRAVVDIAIQNVRRAGFDDKILIRQRELTALHPEGPAGWIMCNPPYGQRLSEKQHLGNLYRFIGHRLRGCFSGWNLALFTSTQEHADLLRFRWHDTKRLYNGPLSCTLFLGAVPPPDPVFCWEVGTGHEQVNGVDFLNRLKKNCAKIIPWARERGLECFRLYDGDLPDYNVRIDCYRKWVIITEYPQPKTIDSLVAKQRFDLVVKTVRQLLGAGPDRLVINRRQQRRVRKGQSVKEGARIRYHEASEGAALFLIERSSGGITQEIPLDQRLVRMRIGSLADGKHFLNVLDWGRGAATVHAAHGGAKRTTTLVANEKLAEAVEKIFMLNGMHHHHHRVVVDDYYRWLERDQENFDLIYINIRSRNDLLIGTSQITTGKVARSAMRLLCQGGTLFLSVTGAGLAGIDDWDNRWAFRELDREMLPRDCERMARHSRFWELHYANGAL